MNQTLQIGQTVRTQTTGLACTVEQFLGGGAQGEVYRATLAGQPVALKWYFPQYLQQDQGLRRRLEQIVRFGPPSDRFLWPLDLTVRVGDDEQFGYIMPLREARFRGMADLVTRRVTPSLRALVTVGFELAYHYRELHAKGLCYRDIAFGNVFFDPDTGEVRIGDNDNVDVNNTPGAINGTPRFMAPEIVRGEAEPNAQTDLFSLGVLLFYLLCNHHPLEGKRELAIHCFDQPAMTRLYGQEPLFIFDPLDESNRPVPGEHDNALAFWPLYPQALRDLFTRAFTAGLHDPHHGRVRESEWCTALLRLRDGLFYCTACGAENFYDVATLRAGQTPRCWACQTSLRLPPRLRLQQGTERSIILLTHETRLYGHHLDPNRQFDLSEPWAAVAVHPTRPDVWGLQNRSADKWVVTTADGAVRDVPPGRSVTLAAGTQIHFGTCEGEIRT
jgi:eukaryotic-like serine/threonine-protein kinase